MEFHNKITLKQHSTVWREKSESIAKRDDRTLYNRRGGNIACKFYDFENLVQFFQISEI